MEETIEIALYEQLTALAWNRADPMITLRHALYLYEAGRGQVNRATMNERERVLFDRLVREVGHGVFLG